METTLVDIYLVTAGIMFLEGPSEGIIGRKIISCAKQYIMYINVNLAQLCYWVSDA